MTHRPSTLVALLRAPLALAGMRHLLTPLAVAVMLLGLASNAAAQAPTAFTVSLNPAAVTESSASTNIEVTVTLTGGTFGVARVFRVTTTTIAGGTATAGTDYIPLSATNLTIPATMASGTVTFPFTARFDTVAEPAGETVTFLVGLRSVDLSFGDASIGSQQVVPLTINDYTPVSVSAGPDQTVAPGATIMLAGAVTASNGAAANVMPAWSLVETPTALTTTLGLVTTGDLFDTTREVLELERDVNALTTTTASLVSLPASIGLTSSVTFTLRLTGTDTTAPAGQPTSATSATDDIIITVDPAVTAPAFATGASIDNLRYVTGQMITPVTLPAVATAGPGGTTYSLAPALPAGLTFTPATRAITGTPTTAATTSITYTANDGDADMTAGDTATLMFTVMVQTDLVPTLGTASIADQSFTVGETVALTLPGVTPGTGNISIHYALTPALPDGLTFNAGVRPQPTITGSPTAVAASAEYTYLVTDGDTNTARTDTDMLTFNLVVTAPVLAFTGNVSTLMLYYPVGAAITATTLPAAISGTSPYMYDTPAGATLPAGLTLDAATRILSGTPSAAGSSSFTYRVTDSATPAAMVSLEVTTVICESGGMADGGTVCAVPAFVPLALATPAELAFRHIVSIAPVTLPEATGGTGANPVRIYTLTPLPVGLDFDPATRVISGRPEALGTFTVNYRVGDAGAGNADAQSTTVMFDIVVFGRPFLPVIPDQVYVVGDTVALTLTVPTGGSPPYTYTLFRQGSNDGLPAGLTWNTDVSPQTVTGMPTAVTALANYSYEVTDSRGLTTFKPFSITVNAGADTTPAFAADASIADQFYTVGTPITPLTLPEATGGNGALAYALLAPPGLNFDLTTRVLSGTPTTAAMELTYSYFARDADNDGVALLIMITVNAAGPAPAFADGAVIPVQRYSQGTMITPLTLPEATGGTAPLTYALTRANSAEGLPPGLTFNGAARPPTLTGTPEERTGARGIALAYTVTDADGDTDDSDSDTLFFTLNISPTAMLALDFPVTTGIGTQPNSGAITLYFPLDAAITPVTFPEASGGTGAITYSTRRGGPPFGLTFDATGRVLSGTPTAAGVTTFRYDATDSDTPEAVVAFIEPRIFVCASGGTADGATVCTFPAYTDLELPTPVDQSFIRGETITNVTLPEATAGGTGANPVRIYSATPLPAGLTFEPSTRVISGRPLTDGTTIVNYRVGDAGAGNADNASVTVTFDIVIVPPGTMATGFTVSVEPTTVIESDTPTDLTVRVTLSGGSLAATRVFEIGTQAGTATADTDYTPLTNTLLTLPSLLPASTLIVPFTALTDSVADDGETLSLTVTFLNSERTGPDSSLGDVNLTTITINDPVAGDTAPAFAADAAIPFQRYIVGTPITPPTLPEATGGTAPYTYTLARVFGSSGLPPGLTFNAAARPPTITGTPTEQTGGTTGVAFAYTVADADENEADSDTDTLFFSLEATNAAQPRLAFPTTIGIGAEPNTGTARLFYPLNQPITPTTFPEASGGTPPYTYGTGTASVPVGLTFDATGRVLSGTPTVAGSTRFQYVVTDTMSPDSVSLIAEMVICDSGSGAANGATVCPFPTFVPLALPTPADQSFASGATVDLTLPEATAGGTGTNPVRIYTAMPLPAGLTFDPMTRAITGMPTTVGSTTVNYRVGDTGAGNVDTRSTTVMFDIVVTPPDTAPAFAADAAVPVQLYTVGTMIATLTLPEATAGNGALTYTLARVNSISGLPPGLTFNAAARPPTLTGTPSDRTGTTPLAFVYTVADGDGNTDPGDSDTLFFSLGVFTGAPAVTFPSTTGIGFEPNTGTGATLFYPIGAAITPTTFPAAVGGTTPYTYSTRSGTPPPGLTFDATVRVLSGTPTAAGQSQFDYRVDDSSMPSAFRNLRVRTTICESGGAADGATTCPIPAFVTLALPTPDAQSFVSGALITPLTLPEATSGGTGNNPVRIYTAMPLPAGLTFNPMTRAITGIPTAVGSTTVNYRVGDAGAGNADHLSTTVTFDIVVAANVVPAFAAGETILDQTFTVNTAITPLTLPAVATAGNGDTVYVFNPPRGLTFDPVTRVLTGAPIAPTSPIPGEDTRTYTARDSDGNMAAGDEATLTFRLIVLRDTAPAFAVTDIMTRTYFMNEVVALTLPEATGGNGATTYTLTGATLPAGLTFDGTASPPTITGTAGTAATAMTFTYTAMDADDDAATLTISITVETMADTTPTFTAGAMVADQTFVQNRMLSLTLPAAATAGNGATIYTLTPAIAGLTLNPTTGVLTGTPEATAAQAMYTYTASDSDGTTGAGDEATLTLQITVERQDPTGVTLSLAPDTVRESVATTDITVTATLDGGTFGVERVVRFLTSSGVGTATEATDYTAVPATLLTLPANTASSSVDIRFMAPIDTDDEPAGETVVIGGFLQLPMGTGSDPSVPLTPATLTINDYTIIVGNAGPDQRVAPGDTIMFNAVITAQDETATVTSSWNLKDDAATTDALVAAGVARSAAGAESQRLRGRIRNFDTPTPSLPAPAADLGLTSAVELVFTFTASDTNAPQGYPLPVADEIIITVVPDTAPAFAADASIDNQTYIVGTAITALTLPQATGGNDAITYTLTPAIAGLTLDAATGVLTGTPTTAAAAADYTYTAADSDANEMADDQTSLTVSITVRAAATGLRLGVSGTQGGFAVTVVREGSSRAITVSAAPAPSGSGFAVDQTITFEFTPPPASRPANAADPYVGYTAIAPGTIPFAVGSTTTPSYDFTLVATEDNFDHADFPVTITVTAQPSGVTETATVTLTDNDISIVTTAATASVAPAATTTYDVTLSEAPSADTTVTVASQGTGTATVSPATLLFTTTNWNMAQPVTVTGVAVGSTTISHTAPAGGDFTFVTNDVMVTVTAAGTIPTFASDAMISDQTFTQGTTITPLTLPTATGTADRVIIHALTPTISGMNFDSNTLILSGAPDTVGVTEHTYTAVYIDAASTLVKASLAFTVTVEAGTGTDTAPTFGAVTISPQVFTIGTAVDLTLPAATGGNGAITYALTPAIPGLTLDAATRVLTGTPTTAATATDYTYTAGDTDGSAAGTDEATLTISITVNAAAVRPVFFQLASVAIGVDEGVTALATPTTFFAQAGSETVALTLSGPDAAFFSITQGGALSFRTAPDFEMPRGMAPSGTNTNTYSVTITATASPGGLTQDAILEITVRDVDEAPGTGPTSQTLTINPTAVTESATPTDITVTVTLNGGTFSVARAFQITTQGGTATVGDDYTAVPSTNITIPANMASANVIIPFTATDDMVVEASGETVDFQVVLWDVPQTSFDSALPLMSATLTINDAPTGDTAPTFGGATTPAQVFTIGTAVDLTLPTATGGNGAITYALTPAIPGLTLDAATGVLTGTPTTEAAATDYTYTAADGDDNTDADDAVSLMLSITIEADTTPSFGGAAVSAQTFTIGTAVDLTLPAATGGNGAITYTLTPALPTGLIFNAAARTITGTPTTAAGATDYTYTAGDTDGSAAGTDEVSLMFSITVIQAPPTEIRLSVNPAEVTESTTATTITVTANLIDGTYAAERNITIASTDGTATAGTDYTAVPDTVLTIPANATSATATFSFTTVVDTDDEPGGETVLIGRSSTTGTGSRR